MGKDMEYQYLVQVETIVGENDRGKHSILVEKLCAMQQIMQKLRWAKYSDQVRYYMSSIIKHWVHRIIEVCIVFRKRLCLYGRSPFYVLESNFRQQNRMQPNKGKGNELRQGICWFME